MNGLYPADTRTIITRLLFSFAVLSTFFAACGRVGHTHDFSIVYECRVVSCVIIFVFIEVTHNLVCVKLNPLHGMANFELGK